MFGALLFVMVPISFMLHQIQKQHLIFRFVNLHWDVVTQGNQ